MAFDGIVMHAIVDELNQTITGRKITKIAQPEKEELLLTIRGDKKTFRLLLSANASLPLLYLTEENKKSPMTAPNFCMLLRKYIQNGTIVAVEQMGLERVIRFSIEHLDELGDLKKKFLYIEIMGKHSNIIFCDHTNQIIDSIKHVSFQISSVREVLPGRNYFIPAQENKKDPLSISEDAFKKYLLAQPVTIGKALLGFTGFCFLTASELCCRSDIDSDFSTASLSDTQLQTLWVTFHSLIAQIQQNQFSPIIVYRKENPAQPLEFSAFLLTMYQDQLCKSYHSISEALSVFYSSKNKYMNMHQKSAELRKHVQTLLERNQKKLYLQKKQMADTEKKDRYKLYGELLQTYAHEISAGQKSASVLNYYTNETLQIPLNEQLSPMENSNHFFEKYAKLKRTATALDEYIVETENTILHLESIAAALNLAENEGDLYEIRRELGDYGFLKKKVTNTKKSKVEKSKPLHFISEDGFHLYVGKNNYQNDELTFHFATGNDWWFHVKGQPGSHVIVKTEGQDLPDHLYEDAAALAGYYSSGRDAEKLEIDYVQKKHVKKPNKAALGFVIYHTNYSMTISPGIHGLKEVL